MASSESLADILTSLQAVDPSLLSALSLTQLVQFIVLATPVKEDILLAQDVRYHSDPHKPPDFLPQSVQQFLSEAIGVGCEVVRQCWLVLKHLIWSPAIAAQLTRDPERSFRASGNKYGLNLSSIGNLTNFLTAPSSPKKTWLKLPLPASIGPVCPSRSGRSRSGKTSGAWTH